MNYLLCFLLLMFWRIHFRPGEACPFGCASCNFSGCERCNPSFMLISGRCYPCPSNCNGCDGYNCTACASGTWGTTCQHRCQTNCLQGCQRDNGYCYQCRNGLYGPTCNEHCSLCKYGLCDSLKCRYGCKSGYYEYKIGEITTCKTCSRNCISCKNATECTVCDDGFYVNQYNSTTGSIYYCAECFSHIPVCKNNCVMPNCNNCQVQNDSLVCEECKQGYTFNGSECILAPTDCSEGCSGACDDSGKCLGICIDGYTGVNCSGHCASQCVRCSRTNGNICEQCKGDYFTTSCNICCPFSCTKIQDKQTCTIHDGYCLNGCDGKFWGVFCNQSCPSGCLYDNTTQGCKMEDGKCKHGCKNGFTGENCKTIITTTNVADGKTHNQLTKLSLQTDTPEKSSPTTLHIQAYTKRQDEGTCKNEKFLIIGYVSGIGTILMVEVIILIIFYARRRYLAHKSHIESTNESEMSAYYNVNAGNTIKNTVSDGNDYEKLGENRNTDTVYSGLGNPTVQQTSNCYTM